MGKIESIMFSISFIALFFLHNLSFDPYSSFFAYTFMVIYIGFLIAPEVSPKTFKSPHLFQLSIGMMAGIFASYAMHAEPKTFISIVAISACIGYYRTILGKIIQLYIVILVSFRRVRTNTTKETINEQLQTS